MIQMLTPASSSFGWDVAGTKVTENFSESEETRLVNKGLAIYVKTDVFGNCWETDSLGIVQIRLLGTLLELSL